MKTGLSASRSHVVADSDLATEWENDMPVLATPVLLWHAERACMSAIADELLSSQMTLGIAHDVEHLAPTPAGFGISVEATLVKVEGRSLVFEVLAYDDDDLILKGTHSRAIVDTARFGERVEQKNRDRRQCSYA